MTTAARPTFDPARGGTGRGEKDLSALSKQYSSRDLPGHTKLKYRQEGQGTSEELRSRDFRKELDEREVRSKNIPATVRKAIEANLTSTSSSSSAPTAKRPKLDAAPPSNLDADDPVDNDSSEDEDSDDDTAALLAELNKIKQERAQDDAKKEKERKEQEEKIRMENILQGNPLLNYTASVKSADLKVKRRWDDDVVFKNCARNEPDKKSHFINDSLRSEFHKKFMEKYIK